MSGNSKISQKANLCFLCLYSGFEQTSQAHSVQLQAQATSVEELHSKIEMLQQTYQGYQTLEQTRMQDLQLQVKQGKPYAFLYFESLYYCKYCV